MRIKSIKDFGSYLAVIVDRGNSMHTFSVDKTDKTTAEIEATIRAEIARFKPLPRPAGAEVTGDLAKLKDEVF